MKIHWAAIFPVFLCSARRDPHHHLLEGAVLQSDTDLEALGAEVPDSKGLPLDAPGSQGDEEDDSSSSSSSSANSASSSSVSSAGSADSNVGSAGSAGSSSSSAGSVGSAGSADSADSADSASSAGSADSADSDDSSSGSSSASSVDSASAEGSAQGSAEEASPAGSAGSVRSAGSAGSARSVGSAGSARSAGSADSADDSSSSSSGSSSSGSGSVDSSSADGGEVAPLGSAGIEDDAPVSSLPNVPPQSAGGGLRGSEGLPPAQQDIVSAGIPSASIPSQGGVVGSVGKSRNPASGGNELSSEGGSIRNPASNVMMSAGAPAMLSNGVLRSGAVNQPPLMSRIQPAAAAYAKPRREKNGKRLDCGKVLKGRRRMPSVAAFNTLVLALSGRSQGKDPDKMTTRALEVLRSTFSQSKQGMDWMTFYDMTDCAVTPNGRTFLMQMIAMGYNAALEEPVAFQLRVGPLRELRDDEGNNVLHLAVKSGNADVCDRVISVATAEDEHAIEMFEAKNNAGQIPLSIAQMQKQLDIIRLLQSQYTVLEATRDLSH